MLNENKSLQSTIEEDENFLEESAESVGLKAEIPKVGSNAYERLKDACEHYTETVIKHRHATSSPLLSDNEKAKDRSEKERRSVHNQLCVMLLGTTWHETQEDDRRTVSNFAVTVGGRDDYVGSF